jgi:DNA-binding protein H-NS
MEYLDLKGMSLDELWTLHERISSLLSARIVAEKQELEKRLVQLNRGKDAREAVVELTSNEVDRPRQRRKYPRVFPKYQNPSAPEETWSGRGKQPRWLVSALKAGSKIEDFKIAEGSNRKARSGAKI